MNFLVNYNEKSELFYVNLLSNGFILFFYALFGKKSLYLGVNFRIPKFNLNNIL